MRSIKLNLFTPLALAAAYLLGFLQQYLIMYFIMLFHELAHLVALSKKEIEVSYIEIQPFGINIKLKNSMIKNPDSEIYMAIAGPLCNFILALAVFAFKSYFKIYNNNIINFFIIANLFCGIMNLIPAMPLDGGRILRAYLTKFMGYVKAFGFMERLTRFISILIISLGVYVLIITKFNFSIVLIGCFLYFNLLTDRRNFHYYLMKELTEYKRKNHLEECINAYHLAVNGDMKARKVLKSFSHNRYYIINVIREQKIAGIITEGQLIDGLIKYGSNVSLKELIRYKW